VYADVFDPLIGFEGRVHSVGTVVRAVSSHFGADPGQLLLGRPLRCR
jgi:hypothetical protein